MTNHDNTIFFNEGTQSYVQACRAIREYENIVQQKSKEVLDNSLGSLASSGGVQIDSMNISSYRNQDANLEWVSLGVRCTIPPYGAYFVAANLYEDGRLEADVTFETHTVSDANLILKCIKTHPESALKNFTTDHFKYDVQLLKTMDSISLENLYGAWQDLLNDWIVFWKSTQGFKKIFGR